MAESKTKRSRTRQTTDVAEPWRTELQSLSFNEAQTALELAMAKLQSSDLKWKRWQCSTGEQRPTRSAARVCWSAWSKT